MKARIKGTTEWKEYKEALGPDHELVGLETLGYWQSGEDYCKEHGIAYNPDNPLCIERFYKSKILPLECFDLWEEPNWAAFRREAAKDILAGWYSNPDSNEKSFEQMAKMAIEQADELIKQLKEEQK